MYSDPANIRKHVVKLSLSDSEMESLRDAADRMSSQPATAARTLAIDGMLAKKAEFQTTLADATRTLAACEVGSVEHRRAAEKLSRVTAVLDAMHALER